MNCCTYARENVTADCGRVYSVCRECDNGINPCTEGFCDHRPPPPLRSTEETRFEDAFYAVLARNPRQAPGPTAINLELGREHGRTPLNVLNGRMSRLRRYLLMENGFEQDARFGRWRKPEDRA